MDQTERYKLIAMWVEPESRGLGVAGCLLNAVQYDSISRGFGEVFLDVAVDNLRASRFYRKHGFVFFGEAKPLASNPEIHVLTMKWQSIL